MSSWRARSTAEQLFEFLREELFRGRWRGTMPGVHRLSAEFQVNRKTVEAALKLLEAEGLLIAQGAGRRRKINDSGSKLRKTLQVAIFLYEPSDRHLNYIVDLKHQLGETGYSVIIAPKTLVDLAMDVKRVAREAGKIEADAWIVLAGSKGVLEWFLQQPVPAFALLGRHGSLPMASATPDRIPAIRDGVRRLCALGHRRIVFLGRSLLRLPNPGFDGRAFIEELEDHGIRTGPYNLPNWEDSPEGLQDCLDSLFIATPPTAMLIDEAFLFSATQHHLGQKGITAPRDVSLICAEDDPTFNWCRPEISHINWDSHSIVRRVLRWANHIRVGKEDHRKFSSKAKFNEGGTIGPVSKGC